MIRPCLLAALFALLLSCPSKAFATTCIQSSPEEQLTSAEVAFVGRVISTNRGTMEVEIQTWLKGSRFYPAGVPRKVEVRTALAQPDLRKGELAIFFFGGPNPAQPELAYLLKCNLPVRLSRRSDAKK